MKLLLVLMAMSACAADWSAEKLFRRPYVWGTSPEGVEWAKKKPVVVFLWNAEGRRFLDVYAYDAVTKRRARVTELEFAEDEFSPRAEDADERLKGHKMPEAGVTSVAVREDGERVAFIWRGDVWTAATAGGSKPARLTQTKAAEGNVAFSPDGKRISYTRGGELFVVDLGTGLLAQLTEASGGNVTGYKWSPEGERIVYHASAPGARTQVLPVYSGRFVTARPFPRGVAGDEPGPAKAFIVASRGGKALALGDSELGARAQRFLPEWSPDSRSLLGRFASQDSKKQVLGVIDAATGKVRTVAVNTDERWVARGFAMWSPDGKEIAFSSDRSGFIHLYKVPAGGGEAVQLTKGDWELDTERFGFAPEWKGDRIFYSSTEDGTEQRQFYSIAGDGTGKRKISTRPGVHVGVASEDGKHVAMLSADLDNPLDLYVDGARVTVSPGKEFKEYAWPRTEFVSFRSRGDGAAVKAKLLLPPGYAAGDGKHWPSVFFIHGAGIASSVLRQWGSYHEVRYAFNAYLANKGYVVMDLDYRGSSGYGRDWRTGVYLHMGGKDLDDVLGAVDFMKARGNFDMGRVGIWGVSYGGFMTNMALFLSPGTFKAGSAWAAVNDWENYNQSYTRERLTTPAENPEAYRRSSPITYSAMLRDNLMMVHGMGDTNVLFQDAVQLSEKLIQEGKLFEEIFYPQEDHGFVRDETWVDAVRRTAAFFDRHLQ